MDIIVAIVNALPDNVRFVAMDVAPFIWNFLGLFFQVWEDGSISL